MNGEEVSVLTDEDVCVLYGSYRMRDSLPPEWLVECYRSVMRRAYRARKSGARRG